MSFFIPDKPGVPISTTSSEPETYAILHLGGSHAPLGRGVGQTIAAARSLTVAHKGPPGASVSGRQPLDNPTYRLLGFENKFSPPFEFEYIDINL